MKRLKCSSNTDIKTIVCIKNSIRFRDNAHRLEYKHADPYLSRYTNKEIPTR